MLQGAVVHLMRFYECTVRNFLSTYLRIHICYTSFDYLYEVQPLQIVVAIVLNVEHIYIHDQRTLPSLYIFYSLSFVIA